MKKSVIITIVFLVILALTGLGFIFRDTLKNLILENSPQEAVDITDNPIEDPIEIKEEEETNDQDEQKNELMGILNEIQEELNEDLPPKEVAQKKLMVKSSNENGVELYENIFIRFTYPKNIAFSDENISSITIIHTETKKTVGTINIYNNVENEPLEEFMKKENLVDYFTEGQQRGIETVEIDIPTSKRTVKFFDYPEVVVSDIYLLQFEGLVVVAKDFSEDKIVGEYLIRSMEKTR